MGILSKIFGGGSETVKAVAEGLDELFTADDERLTKVEAMARLAMKPHLAQAQITLIDASSRNIFQAGWRPAIGWCCAIGLAFVYFLNPLMQWHTGAPGPVLPLDQINEMVWALLGLAGMRSFEKIAGAAK